VVVTWAPVRASSCVRETQRRRGMDARQIMRIPTPFIGPRRKGRRYHGTETTNGKCSYSMFPFWGEEWKGAQRPFQKGKGACEVILGFHAEGRSEDAVGRWCAATSSNQSRATFGLTRGGRQSVESVESKGCLDQILLWRSNKLENRMDWEREILGPKENCEENFGLLQFK
jgi:hypothetical protein